MAGALVLIGFMGAGKSSAARALHRDALDSDAEVVRRTGTPVAELFAREGEAAFRAREEEVVLDLLARARPGQPVALGGGAVLSPRVQAALRRHTVAWLEVDLDAAWSRASRSDRPLARDRDTFARLHAQREPLYARLADAFLPDGALPAAVGALRELRGATKLVWSRAHPVWVGEDAWPAPRPADVLISDETVAPLHAAGLGDVPTLTFPPGERHKTLATAERLWRALAARGTTRAARVLAVGGGVVGDVAGFVAATYQRGLPVVHVPTTLVAQVDSALGGKTGVDLPEGKNYVGAFHQPEAVHVVPSTLATLPAAERAAGYAEVLKTALIAGGGLWERVARGEAPDAAMVLACARTKLRVVDADERDGGRRQVLNLGHTVGHAIETTTGYARFRHGEAVGLGLLAALRLSGQRELRARVAELLAAQGLPTRLEGADPDAVAEATRADKKRTGAEVPFVLIDAPGDVHHGCRVPDADLRAAVRELAA